MTEAERRKAIKNALKNGNWMVRADNDGISYGGFSWPQDGSWVEAADWNDKSEYGSGLHGQTRTHGGYITGHTMRFVETSGRCIELGDKVKVQRARILLTDLLPFGIAFEGNLSLHGCTGLTSLPEGLSVGGHLSLYGCTGLTRALPP